MATPPATTKVVYEWRVQDGAHAEFEAWARSFLAYAERTGGLEGSSVLRSGDDYFVLLRFVERDVFERFAAAEATREHFAAARRHAHGGERPQLRSGFETWFTLPGQPSPVMPPPRWKMAIVTWAALMPQVIVLGWLLPPMPFPTGPAVGTAIPVAMLTWVVMPRLTRLLAGWLYARRAAVGR